MAPGGLVCTQQGRYEGQLAPYLWISVGDTRWLKRSG